MRKEATTADEVDPAQSVNKQKTTEENKRKKKNTQPSASKTNKNHAKP
jgi:hypothetical protein